MSSGWQRVEPYVHLNDVVLCGHLDGDVSDPNAARTIDPGEAFLVVAWREGWGLRVASLATGEIVDLPYVLTSELDVRRFFEPFEKI